MFQPPSEWIQDSGVLATAAPGWHTGHPLTRGCSCVQGNGPTHQGPAGLALTRLCLSLPWGFLCHMELEPLLCSREAQPGHPGRDSRAPSTIQMHTGTLTLLTRGARAITPVREQSVVPARCTSCWPLTALGASVVPSDQKMTQQGVRLRAARGREGCLPPHPGSRRVSGC